MPGHTTSSPVRAFRAAVLTACTVAGAPLAAQPIADAAADFLPTYSGPRNGDLDVLSGAVTFDGTSFRLTSTQAAAVGTTPGAFYVWGVNRGQGTARFPTLAPGVLFDAVVILRPDGTAQLNDFLDATRSRALVGSVGISGSTITGVLPASFLVSAGLPTSGYTFNLWPRLAAGTQPIADFAPDNASVLATSTVPEPSTWMLLGGGVAMLAAGARRRRVGR